MKPLIYLASPYSHSDASVRQARYEQVCQIAKKLTQYYIVYSPIAHWHPIAVKYGMPTDAQFWKEQNESMIDVVDVVVVAGIEGWEQSLGVKMEIDYANKQRIPIVYVDGEGNVDNQRN